MGERSDQIEQEIRERRRELSNNFGELEEKIKRAIDWRSQFEQRPGTMLAVAFGGGVLLSALLGPRHTYRKAYNSAATNSPYMPNRPSATAASQAISTPTVVHRGEARENLAALGDALLGVAVSRVTGIVDYFLPGFQQEFTRVKGKSRNYDYESSTARENSQSDWGRPS